MARDRSEVHVLGGLWSSFARQALFSFIFQTWHFSSSSTLEIVMTEKSCSRREFHSPKEALHRFVTRSAINADNKGTSPLGPFADDWTDLVLRAHGEAMLALTCLPASTCNMARGEFDRSSWSSTSMITDTDRSPDDVSQLRKSKTTKKEGFG